jgi:hypothetical protein
MKFFEEYKHFITKLRSESNGGSQDNNDYLAS